MLLPLGQPSLDGRIVTNLTVEMGQDIPLYLGRLIPVGHLLNVNLTESKVLVRALVTMPDQMPRDRQLSFKADLDRIQWDTPAPGCWTTPMRGRLRRVVLGFDPAFTGTEVRINESPEGR
jgi:hypothetical protein